MTEKEISEIRRRFKPEKTNISRVRGCLINEKCEIISEFDQSFALMYENESEALLSLLRKTLSGAPGRNLYDIDFTANQVLEAKEHGLLMRLRDSALDDGDAVREFYMRAASSCGIEGNFLILLACDAYDVFRRTSDGGQSEDSSSVFNYFMCAVCPVKLSRPALSYFAEESAFHSVAGNSVVAPPELGFMFPAFDARTANIYGALYYTRSVTDNHAPFAEAVFARPIPMCAGDQRSTFHSLLRECVAEECNIEVVQSLRAHVCEMVEEHKASRDDEPLTVTKRDIGGVLRECGVSEEKVEDFERKYDEEFGSLRSVRPQNIVETKQIEVRTPDVVIKVNPEHPELVRTRVIDDEKYILIRAGDNVQIDGVEIEIEKDE